MFAFRQIAELQRPDGHADQSQHFKFHGFHHAADLPVPAFIENDLEPAVFLAGAQATCPLGVQYFAILVADSVALSART